MSRMLRSDMLEVAKTIAEDYDGNLTLRQLYYQLVAGGHIGNSQQEYKRLGDTIGNARMAGDFPFSWLLDRTRESHKGKFTAMQDDVDDALVNAANELIKAPEQWLWSDRWYGQPVHVSVWVEKEALAGVFEEPCDTLGVSRFTLRGYSSLSSLYEWVTQVSEAHESRQEAGVPIEKAVILYFGDHDPDGWEIPRSAFRNVKEIAEVTNHELPPLVLSRVALTMAQIRQYNPPPFPAKETSSRFAGYEREHGTTDAWELDALPPRVLADLIRTQVTALWDQAIFEDNADHIAAARRDMKNGMDEEWFDDLRSRM